MGRMLLEVIVQSVSDAREAFLGGADRLEVVRAIADGGLTPSLSLVRAIAVETSLPLRVMVRENAGYAMDFGELPALRRAAAEFAAAGVDGIVIGFARRGEPALDDVARVLHAAPRVPVTFHRAFDTLRDPLHAIDELARIAQVDRVLTTGRWSCGHPMRAAPRVLRARGSPPAHHRGQWRGRRDARVVRTSQLCAGSSHRPRGPRRWQSGRTGLGVACAPIEGAGALIGSPEHTATCSSVPHAHRIPVELSAPP